MLDKKSLQKEIRNTIEIEKKNKDCINNYRMVYIIMYWWRDNQLTDEDFHTAVDIFFDNNTIDKLKKEINDTNNCLNIYQVIFLIAYLMRTGHLAEDDFRKMTDSFFDEDHINQLMKEINS